MLRKFSWQWRILTHHAVRVQTNIVSLEKSQATTAKGIAEDALAKQTSEGTLYIACQRSLFHDNFIILAVISPLLSQEFKGLSKQSSSELKKSVGKSDLMKGRIELTDDDLKGRRRGVNVIRLENNGKGLRIDKANGESIGISALGAFARQMLSGDVESKETETSVTKQTVRALREVCKRGL